MWVISALALTGILQQIICTESVVETICFGDTSTIKCPQDEKLEIYGAFYKLLADSNTTVCRHNNQASQPCDQPQLKQLVQSDCNGKNQCSLGYRDKDGNIDCRPSMYLNVIYACVLKTDKLSTTQMASDVFLPFTEPSTNTTITTTMDVVAVGSNKEAHMILTRLLVQFKLVYEYCLDNQREMMLSAILGIVAGILVFIFLIMVMFCWEKCSNKRKGEFDVEDGGHVLEVTSPISMTTPVPVKYETVLVTRQNGIPLSETTLSSDSTLTMRGKGKKEHQVISTIKRTHSVDEGTQTDIEEENVRNLPTRQLSVQETEELGYLVDSMNYYNKRLYDDDLEYGFHPKSPSSVNASEFYYSSTERKPLLEKTRSVDAYSGQDDSSSDDKLHIPQKTFSRNPSELSYTASVSNNSLDFYTTDQVYNSTPLRYNSMQRAIPQPPRTPKPGVRGDGFDFIH